MDVSIVIVNWNTEQLLKRCLGSIYAHTRGISFEIFVIDNNSKDKSVEMVQRAFPIVQLVTNRHNKGFAAANNQGITKSKAAFILLLNPDTELTEDSLSIMVQWMNKEKQCGIAGCHLINADGTHQDSVRSFPSWKDQVLILLKLHHLFPHLKSLEKYVCHNFNYASPHSVQQVMGAFFMIKREAIDAIGLLDEKFFAWFEEVDYCKRAIAAHFGVWYTPKTKIIHHGGQSFGQLLSHERQKIWNSSIRYYFKKHHSFVAYMAIAAASYSALLASYVLDIFLNRAKKYVQH